MEEKRPVGRPKKYGRGQNPNSLKTLEKYKFKQGESGNIKGRRKVNPQKPTMDAIVTKVGSETCQYNGVKMTKFEKLVRILFKGSFEGKPTAQKELVERIWGKTPDNINMNLTERKEFKGDNPEKYVQDILNKKAKA